MQDVVALFVIVIMDQSESAMMVMSIPMNPNHEDTNKLYERNDVEPVVMAGIEQVGTQGTDTCSGIRDRKAVKLVDLFVVGEGVVCVTNGIRCSCG